MLLGQQERGEREKHREREKEAGPPRRVEGWVPEEGRRLGPWS